MKRYCYNFIPFDLHVLNTPPAFVLSQNQTLRKKRMGRSRDRLKLTVGNQSEDFSQRRAPLGTQHTI